MVQLFNNLNRVQPIRVRDRKDAYYTVFVEAKRSVTLEPYQLTRDIESKLESGALIKVPSNYNQNVKSVVIVDNIKSESVDKVDQNSDELTSKESSEDQSDIGEHSSEESEVLTTGDSQSVYKCDICGGEFASEKGLSMHKSKSHK